MSHHHTQHANLTCYVLSFESRSQEKMQHQLSSEVQKKSTELLKTQRQMASMASELRAKNAELEELHTKNTALAMTEMHNKHAREENRRLLDEQQKRFLQLRAPQQARPRDDATDTSTPVTPAVVSDDVGRAGAGEESTGAAFTPVPKFTFREIYARGGGEVAGPLAPGLDDRLDPEQPDIVVTSPRHSLSVLLLLLLLLPPPPPPLVFERGGRISQGQQYNNNDKM